MKTFKSIDDVDRLRNDPVYSPIHDTIDRLVASFVTDPNYRPENDGYLVLIERDDVDRVLDDLNMPYRLSEVPFEGVTMIDGHYHAFYLPNNQFGLVFLIPDVEWVDGELRRQLEDHLDP